MHRDWSAAVEKKNRWLESQRGWDNFPDRNCCEWANSDRCSGPLAVVRDLQTGQYPTMEFRPTGYRRDDPQIRSQPRRELVRPTLQKSPPVWTLPFVTATR